MLDLTPSSLWPAEKRGGNKTQHTVGARPRFRAGCSCHGGVEKAIPGVKPECPDESSRARGKHLERLSFCCLKRFFFLNWFEYLCRQMSQEFFLSHFFALVGEFAT